MISNNSGPISSSPTQVSSVSISPQNFRAQIQEQLRNEKTNTKEKALEKLKQLFSELTALSAQSPERTQLLVNILGRYGIRQYPDFEVALAYLQTSIQLQLQILGILREGEDLKHYEKIEDFKNVQISKSTQNPHLFSFINTTHEGSYRDLLSSLPNEAKLDFANTLVYLGHCYTNLGAKYLQVDEKTHLRFLTQLYNGAKNILESMLPSEQTEQIQEQLGELQYNNFPGLYLKKCELENEGKVSREQLENSFSILDEAVRYNHDISMKARIANLKSCRARDYLGDLSLAKSFAEESLRLWQEALQNKERLSEAKYEQYKGLHANVQNNRLALLSAMGIENLEEMKQHVEYCLRFYKDNKEKHPYSMMHLLNLARYKKLQGDVPKALKYLNKVKGIAAHYKTWPYTEKCLEKAEVEIQSLNKNS